MPIIRKIDAFLNSITMYRLVLYGLSLLALISILFGFTHTISYEGIPLIGSLLLLIFSCFFSNILFGKIFKAPTNIESSWITGFILFFIMEPATTLTSAGVLALVSILAMASKYIFAIGKRHILNPAATAIFILGLCGNGSAIWWVASLALLPFTIVLGILVVRKIRRFNMVLIFLIVSTLTILTTNLIHGGSVTTILSEVLISWPIVFFGTIMLTEPLTTPAGKGKQLIYGALVGLLFGAQFQIGIVYSTPGLALVVGNIFSFIINPKKRVMLTLREKKSLTSNIFEFIFSSDKKINFKPGQYLEWTVPHAKPDTRGVRRYFTIASSPTEKDLKLGVRIEKEHGSTFKKTLFESTGADTFTASDLAGDFILPTDKNKKLVFIAGGIGITPFRSMVKYLMDTQERRDITILYSNRSEDDIAYKELWNEASSLGIHTVHVLTENVPADWHGQRGFINEAMIKEVVPDYKERAFYISGPNGMVTATKAMLKKMGVRNGEIKTDFFPGFA